MPKLTIMVDEEVLRWARVKAAEEDTSVARLVGDLLKDSMRAERGHQTAKRRFLGAKPRILSRGPYPSRDDVHDRSGLR
jgi:hypothetical protein